MINAIKNGGLKRGAQAFFEHEAAGGVVLMAAAALALILSNSPLSWMYDALLGTPVVVQIGALAIDKPLLLWINDGLMAIFFFLVGSGDQAGDHGRAAVVVEQGSLTRHRGGRRHVGAGGRSILR